MSIGTCICWNVNGIRSVMKKDFLGFLKRNNADLLCLQEVRAEGDQIPDFEFKALGYETFWFAAEKKGYSGVGVLCKKKPDEVIYGLGNATDSEGRVIQVRYENTLIYNIYFPNGGASDERLEYKMKFYDLFLEHALANVNKGLEVIVCGDFNTCHQEIDIARPKENQKKSGFLPMERAWMDGLVQAGFVDVFRNENPTLKDQYTWWSNRGGARERNVGWRIDYFFASQNSLNKIKSPLILKDELGSDHCPISIVIE